MKLTVNSKEYTIKFGIEATVTSGIINAEVQREASADTESDLGALNMLQNAMVGIAEKLLVGLQAYHSDEFGYNYKTNEDKDEKLSKVYELLDTYLDEGGNISDLGQRLSNELVANSFLGNMLTTALEAQRAQKSAQKKTTKK